MGKGNKLRRKPRGEQRGVELSWLGSGKDSKRKGPLERERKKKNRKGNAHLLRLHVKRGKTRQETRRREVFPT